jgi:hypothetical protein
VSFFVSVSEKRKFVVQRMIPRKSMWTKVMMILKKRLNIGLCMFLHLIAILSASPLKLVDLDQMWLRGRIRLLLLRRKERLLKSSLQFIA